MLGGSILLHVLLRSKNAKRLSGRRDMMYESRTPDEIWVAVDKRPNFVYTL